VQLGQVSLAQLVDFLCKLSGDQDDVNVKAVRLASCGRLTALY
jgi:hypothetical protein